MINYREKAAERARVAARALMKAVNEMGFDNEAFAEEVCGDNRTLQQNAFRAIGAVLIKMAWNHEAGYEDLRNAHTGMVAAKIVANYGGDLRFVPFI